MDIGKSEVPAACAWYVDHVVIGGESVENCPNYMKIKKVYLCNRKQCGEKCSYPICKATTDEKYALDISIPFYRHPETGDLVQEGCFEE